MSLLFWPISVGSQSQTSLTCASDSRLARLAFTVVDDAGESPADVKKEDLSLKINGNAASVLDLELQVGKAIDLAILIDTSISQEGALPLTKLAAKGVIETLLTADKDRAALISFSNEVEVEHPLTEDFAKLSAALNEVKLSLPPGYIGGGVVVSRGAPQGGSRTQGSTSLWDIVARAMEQMYGPTRDLQRSRAIILLTDGNDTSSEGKLNASIASAIQHDVPIYSIGVAGRYYTLNRDSLKRLSDQTAGIAAFPKKPEDLKSILLDIGKRLRSNYVVTYCDPQSGTAHKVRMDITNPKLRRARIAYRR